MYFYAMIAPTMTQNARYTAAAAGLTRYQSDKPCARGHLAERYTSTGNCCECLKSRNKDVAAVLRGAKVPGAHVAQMFAYRLHPDDHAAALAFCQALDLQRGRQPKATNAIAPAVQPRSATAEEVQAHRERILGNRAAAVQTEAPRRLPEEMAATLRAHGLPV